MNGRENARRAALAVALIFVSTVAVLTARQMNVLPPRPAPAYRTFGPADAPIQLIEYTDLACPACAYASELVDNLLRVYGGNIRLVFKHYPLTGIHPWSLRAAALADCAGEQGRFKEYAALLFANQKDWAEAKQEPPQFEDYARQLKLDWPGLQACAATPEAQRAIMLDMGEGRTRGVSATPTFFVNGKRTVGGGQLLDQARNFDNLLKAAGKARP